MVPEDWQLRRITYLGKDATCITCCCPQLDILICLSPFLYLQALCLDRTSMCCKALSLEDAVRRYLI